MDIRGKRVLVTGGGSGIGLGVALALAQEGCRVAISGRKEEKLKQAAAEFQGEPAILLRACDVSDRDDVRALFDWVGKYLGGIDILVNSAGVNTARRRFDVLDPADWDRLMAINATGAFNTMHCAIPGMRAQGGGLIVNISSIAGKRCSELAGPAYCASKFAMTALGAAVGLEERDNNIHVTSIYPGEVNTPILAERPVPPPPERLAKMLMPEDIASMVVALARLHPRAVVNELVITPLYQGYAWLGFSKSGWGALCLLLRHPDTFGKAAAWDAPLMMDHPGPYGSGPIFGTEENFAGYEIAALLRSRADQFQGQVRLIHFGYGNFREHHEAAHQLMEKLAIAHVYRDGPRREHSWHSGWLPEAVEMLTDAESE